MLEKTKFGALAMNFIFNYLGKAKLSIFIGCHFSECTFFQNEIYILLNQTEFSFTFFYEKYTF